MRRVFDDPQTVICGEALQAREVHHHSANMNRHDANDFGRFYFCLIWVICGQPSRGIVEVHIQRDRLAIDQYRNCSLIAHDFGCRRKRHRRNQNTLSRLKAKRFYG